MKAAAVACVVAVTLAVLPTAQERPVQGLTAVPELARAYDAIFDARFDDVPALRAQACGPAPPEVCQLLDAVALWWQIQLDPANRSRDARFRALADTAIAAASAWTEREPQRAEAWFYLGCAYGARVQWRALRGENLAAARDGTRIKNALERAIALDPGMQDAYFGIGLYHYYADVAPLAARMLRWLLLLPGGDRVAGLEEMLRARDRGRLVRSEADYQLHLLYLWYEKQTGRALEVLAGLRERHPQNPHFLQAAAEIEDVYLHDAAASLRTWETLLTAARERRVALAEPAEAAARLGAALQLARLNRPTQAADHLRVVIAMRPAAPYDATALAHLQLADVLLSIGRSTEAAAEYRAAITTSSQDDPLRIRTRANAQLRTRR